MSGHNMYKAGDRVIVNVDQLDGYPHIKRGKVGTVTEDRRSRGSIVHASFSVAGKEQFVMCWPSEIGRHVPAPRKARGPAPKLKATATRKSGPKRSSPVRKGSYVTVEAPNVSGFNDVLKG